MTDQGNSKVQVYFIPQNPEILAENLEEVVLSGDVAQETIVVTTTDDESVGGDFNESSVVPIENLDVLNTIELSCDENFQSSLEPSPITPSDLGDGNEESFVQSYIALVPNNESRLDTELDNSHLTVKELTKREKDRMYKREQRANKEYREQEKVQAKQRMKDRRKDPEYREKERKRDAERRKLARLNNKEFRQKEKERDRQYKRDHRKKSNSCLQSDFANRAGVSLSSSDTSENLTVSNCFTVLDWTGISSSDVDVKLSQTVDESDVTEYQMYDQDSM